MIPKFAPDPTASFGELRNRTLAAALTAVAACHPLAATAR
jgi:hypothetical protein